MTAEITNDEQSELLKKIASEILTANGQMKGRRKGLMGVMPLPGHYKAESEE